MNLPREVDPSLAATVVLARIEPFATGRNVSPELRRLRELFEEAESWPRAVACAGAER